MIPKQDCEYRSKASFQKELQKLFQAALPWDLLLTYCQEYVRTKFCLHGYLMDVTLCISQKLITYLPASKQKMYYSEYNIDSYNEE